MLLGPSEPLSGNVDPQAPLHFRYYGSGSKMIGYTPRTNLIAHIQGCLDKKCRHNYYLVFYLVSL